MEVSTVDLVIQGPRVGSLQRMSGSRDSILTFGLLQASLGMYCEFGRPVLTCNERHCRLEAV